MEMLCIESGLLSLPTLTASSTIPSYSPQNRPQRFSAPGAAPLDIFEPLSGSNCTTFDLYCNMDIDFICEYGMGCSQLLKSPRCMIFSDSQALTMSKYGPSMYIDPSRLWTRLSTEMIGRISHSATSMSTPTSTSTSIPTATQTGGGLRAANAIQLSTPTTHGLSSAGDILWGMLIAWGFSTILLLAHFL